MPTLTNNEKEKAVNGALNDTLAAAKAKTWAIDDMVSVDGQSYKFDPTTPLGADIAGIAFNPTAAGTMLNLKLEGVQLSTADAAILVAASINPVFYWDTTSLSFKFTTPTGSTVPLPGAGTQLNGIISVHNNTAVTALVLDDPTPVEVDAGQFFSDAMDNFQLTTFAGVTNERVQLECLAGGLQSFYIIVNGTLERSGGTGTNDYMLEVFKNGVVIPNYAIKLAASINFETFSLFVPTTGVNTDTFEVFLTNIQDSDDAIIAEMQLLVRKIA